MSSPLDLDLLDQLAGLEVPLGVPAPTSTSDPAADAAALAQQVPNYEALVNQTLERHQQRAARSREDPTVKWVDGLFGAGGEDAPSALPPPPAAPQDDVPIVGWPSVPSNAPTGPEAPLADRMQMVMRMLGSGGPTQMGAPKSITPARLTDADVQAQLQDPRVRAVVAPSAGEIDFRPEDFLDAPEGEDQLEQFAFREMAVLGNRTPQAVQNMWVSLQSAKRDRLKSRSDYLAGLVKDRFASDLARRNQDDVTAAANGRAALDRISRIREQEVMLDFQRRQTNAQLLEQHKGRLSAEQRAALGMATAGSGGQPLNARMIKEYRGSMSTLRAGGDTLLMGAELFDLARNLSGGVVSGWGDIGNLMARGARFAGNPDWQLFYQRAEMMKLEAIKMLAAVAGARSIDTKAEQDRIASTFPQPGTDPKVAAEWFTMVSRTTRKYMEDEATILNEIIPGRGSEYINDMEGVRERVITSQATATRDMQKGGKGRAYTAVKF